MAHAFCVASRMIELIVEIDPKPFCGRQHHVTEFLGASPWRTRRRTGLAIGPATTNVA